MTKFQLSIVFLALAAQALLTAIPAPREAAAQSCELQGLKRAARCGSVRVPEDPGHPAGRQLDIHFAIVTAKGEAKADPILVLMGGPGEDAISAASLYADWFGSLLDDHDLLLIDQRLTGRSAPAKCHLYSADHPADNLRDFFPPQAVADCRHLLESKVDLARYTFPYFAQDLEQVRTALGYGPVDLFSGSYGTRAAQAFIRQFPKSVRTVYLGSPVPIDAGGPLDFGKTADVAFDKSWDACDQDAACHAAYPSIRQEFAEVVKRLDQGQVTVPVPGSKDSVPLSRGRVIEWLRSALYRPRSAATIPWVIHRAYQGDFAPVAAGILASFRGADEDLNWGLFFAITCNEDLSFVSEAEIEAQTKGTSLGDYRVRQQQAACKDWPKAELPRGYRRALATEVPTLIVTGDRDGGTPLWFTDRVAKGFTRHVTVIARGQGHTEWNPCVAGLFEQLVRSGATEGIEGSKCPIVPQPPFKL
jgi:pimeloyl-ACP methyl ester carboxylesterase